MDKINQLNIKSNYDLLKQYYDNVLNKDKDSFKSTNDEPTPISCIEEMIEKIPNDFWNKSVRIYDPCCGNGNFHLVIYNRLKSILTHAQIKKCLYFNDINELRLENVKKIFNNCYINNNDKTKFSITNYDFLNTDVNILCADINKTNKNNIHKYNLIVANPPYALLDDDGKRTAKNHNLISDFITKSLEILAPDGYLMFIIPDNWMSLADRNTLIKRLTSLRIIHLNIHTAKKYFKKIGSSFTWFVIQNKKLFEYDGSPLFNETDEIYQYTVDGIWKGQLYNSVIRAEPRNYIPLYFTKEVQSIIHKTLDQIAIEKIPIETSSDIHKFTKKNLISDVETDVFKYKLIHTPTQTVYASRPHKYQDGIKVFISTTNKYQIFIDDCGMTQSIAFIRCDNKEIKHYKLMVQAKKYKLLLEHPLYKFLNNICRFGNFNNVRILQLFPNVNELMEQNFNQLLGISHTEFGKLIVNPSPKTYKIFSQYIYKYFSITDEEIKIIEL